MGRGIETGSEVGLHYDPMLAKLIVWAPNRPLAIERMHRALLELTIDGVETSRDFHLRLMEDAEFRRGDIDIQWLEKRLPELASAAAPADVARVAVIAAALLADRDRNRGTPKSRASAEGSGDALLAGTASAGSAWQRAARLEGLR